jgi:hypothetical protein
LGSEVAGAVAAGAESSITRASDRAGAAAGRRPGTRRWRAGRAAGSGEEGASGGDSDTAGGPDTAGGSGAASGSGAVGRSAVIGHDPSSRATRWSTDAGDSDTGGAGFEAARATFRTGAAGGSGALRSNAPTAGSDGIAGGSDRGVGGSGAGRSDEGAGGSGAGRSDEGAGAGPSLMRAPRPCAEPPRAVSLATFRALRSVGESDGSDAIGPTVTSGWASAFSGSPNSHSKLAGPIPRLSGVIAGAGGAAAGSGERASCTGDAAAGSGEGATCTGGAAG